MNLEITFFVLLIVLFLCSFAFRSIFLEILLEDMQGCEDAPIFHLLQNVGCRSVILNLVPKDFHHHYRKLHNFFKTLHQQFLNKLFKKTWFYLLYSFQRFNPLYSFFEVITTYGESIKLYFIYTSFNTTTRNTTIISSSLSFVHVFVVIKNFIKL